jgi:hypothetical protein
MTSSSTPETCVGPTEGALFDNGDLTESSVAVCFEILRHVLLVESHLTKSASNFQTTLTYCHTEELQDNQTLMGFGLPLA